MVSTADYTNNVTGTGKTRLRTAVGPGEAVAWRVTDEQTLLDPKRCPKWAVRSRSS